MFAVEEAGDDRVDDDVHGQGDKGVQLEESVTKAVAVVLNTAWGTKNKRAFKVTIMVGGI